SICTSGIHPILHSIPTRRSSDLYFFDLMVHYLYINKSNEASGRSMCTLALVPTTCLFSLLNDHHNCSFCASNALETVVAHPHVRSEEHTSELQSRENIVCRLLLE